MRIWDGKKSDPGWKKLGSGIRNVYSGSATQHKSVSKVLRTAVKNKFPNSAKLLSVYVNCILNPDRLDRCVQKEEYLNKQSLPVLVLSF